MLRHLVLASLAIVLTIPGGLAGACLYKGYERLLRDGENYFLAYRLTAGINTSAYDVYCDQSDFNDDSCDIVYDNVPCGCKTTYGTLDCDRHYRSMLLDAWNHLPIEKVKVSLYKAGDLKRKFIFSCEKCTFMDFFNMTNLHEAADYSDITSGSTVPAYVSIQGDDDRRRFLIADDISDECDDNEGWIMVVDRRGGDCTYDPTTSQPFPQMLYSAKPSTNGKFVKTKFEDPSTVEKADVLTVSILLDEQHVCGGK